MELKMDSLDSLISGIRTIISKNRSSFTDEEVDLLNACVIRLEEVKKIKADSFFLNTLIEVIEIIAKIFSITNQIDGFSS